MATAGPSSFREIAFDAAPVPSLGRQEVLLSTVVYTSHAQIVRQAGPLRTATLPGETATISFSVHGAIAEHYKIDPAKLTEPHAATIDYVIAAAAG